MKNNKNSSVAIILVNWNGYHYTKKCIISLLNCNYNNYKIIVVDNNSSDNSRINICTKFPSVKYIQNKDNLGFTGANNVGIKWALKKGFDYIMLLNNDTEVDPNFLNHLIFAFKNNLNIGAVQPLILEYDNKDVVWNGGGTIDYKFGRFLNPNRGLKKNNLIRIKNIDWISGCCFIIRSQLLNNVNLLDDFYFVYFEDADLSLRITDLNYSLYIENKSLVYHHEGKSWISAKKNNEGYISPMTHYLNIRNHIYIIKKFRKKFNLFLSTVFLTSKILGYVTYFLIRFRFNKLHRVLNGVRDGLKSSV